MVGFQSVQSMTLGQRVPRHGLVCLQNRLKAEREGHVLSFALSLFWVDIMEQATERWLTDGDLCSWAEQLDEQWQLDFSCICEFAFFIAPLNKLANRILWFLTLLVQSSKNEKGYFGIVYTISYIGHDKDNTLKGKRIRACLQKNQQVELATYVIKRKHNTI